MNAQAAELYAAVEESAGRLGVPFAAPVVEPILTAYQEAFTHAGTMVAFRVATSLAQAGELDCRFMTHPAEREPYAVALAEGLTPKTDAPAGTLLAEIQESCPVDSYGIDFGAKGGFKKIYGFFTPATLQHAGALAALPSMPPALAAHTGFLERHDMAGTVNVIGIDYAHHTVNVYLGAPPSAYEPAAVTAVLAELGMPAPSGRLLALAERAFGLYLTLNWREPAVERICYAVTAAELDALPIAVEPAIARFATSIPYGGARRKFVYGIAATARGEYHKLEAHLKWQPGAMDYI